MMKKKIRHKIIAWKSNQRNKINNMIDNSCITQRQGY